MLPGFIIDQIRQREEEERSKHQVLRIELPIPAPEGSQAPEREDDAKRGVLIIDLGGR